jgi:predicted phosphohydrolase
MSIFVIGDLHLSTNRSTNKSMEKFGRRWMGYTEKLRRNWEAVVSPEDTVVIPGDISWAMKMEEALSDFQFLESLPGQKLIGKGNHDFWWSTVSKMKRFFEENAITTIDVLYNNALETEEFIICGSRGWLNDETKQSTVGNTEPEYQKIVNREAMRLKMSLEEGSRLQKEAAERGEGNKELLAFLHFPPVFTDFICREIIDVLHEYGIKNCFYGHVHGNYFMPRTIEFEGIDFVMTASDFLSFAPMPIHPDY